MPGLPGVPGQQGPALKLLGSVSLGPQPRVITLQVGQGEHATCLVLGVAPGSVNTLHQMPLPPQDAPSETAGASTASAFATRLAQLRKGPGHEPR